MSLSWSAKRQLTYGSIVVLFLLIVFGTPSYFIFFNKVETCVDGKQNQNETGIDCGGLCQKACLEEVIPLPVTLWSRAFPVANGTYNLVAYAQNANIDYTSFPTKYLFRVYDKDNVLINIREGYASVPPTKNFPIFEQNFNAGQRTIGKVFFEFTRTMTWKKYQGDKPELEVSNEHFIASTTIEGTQPRLEATLINKTVNQYKGIEVVAIIYDLNGNAMEASRTVVDSLPGTKSALLIFTWPRAFPSSFSKIEIIPKLPV